MMIIRMSENPVDSPSYRAQPLYGVFLDGDPARKMLVTVQKRGSSMECVECVVES